MSTVRIDSPEKWAHACSAAFVPLGVRASGSAFHAHLRQVALPGGLRVTRVASEQSEVFRSARVIAQAPRDDILLAFHEKGRGRVHQDNRTALLVAGTAALYDTAAPYTLDFPSTMVETIVQFPRTVLHREHHNLRDLTARSLPSTPATRAIAALATCALELEHAGNLALESALTESITALISRAFGHSPPPQDTRMSRESLAQLMLRFIDTHSPDPDLTPAALAAAHHVSLRTVHNAFDSVGRSPAEAIRTTRLHHARQLLQEGQTVHTAAITAGFIDPNTFTRAHRRAFGTPPSQNRNTTPRP